MTLPGGVPAPGRDSATADDVGCAILHVDMDAFFAMVEVRDRPELKGRPVIVGRSQGRGVVVSATYEARELGVHSAMPVGVARRLAPNAVFIDPSRGKYLSASRAVMAILREFTPVIEEVSIDEAFLDVSSVGRSVGSPTAIAIAIRERMSSQLGLPCSVGVAPVTMVAKIASTKAKPDGLLVVPHEGMLRFLHALPVGALWGVGDSTEKRLHSVGVVTVGDISRMPEARLARCVGRAAAQRLAGLAAGLELRPVTPHGREQSIGSEVTFDADVADARVVEQQLWVGCDGLARRLRRSRRRAQQVGIKVRFDDFTTINRSRTLAEPTDSGAELFAAVRQLWARVAEADRLVRLVGVRAERLQEAGVGGEQLTFDAHDQQRARAQRVMDEVADRFGPGAAFSARMLM